MTGPVSRPRSLGFLLALTGAVLLGAGCSSKRGPGASQQRVSQQRASLAEQKAQPSVQPASVQGAEPVFESPARRVHLLELFTSEGCSSCPPAEAWLSSLKDSDRLWSEVVPVAFHVDYWDDLGWEDPFARGAYTRRQRRYAARWPGSGQVYTPGFVLDGAQWRGWFDGKRALPDASEKAGVLHVALRGGREGAAARFTSPMDDLPGTLTLNVALLGGDIAVDVKAGENRGRELAHDFVVLGRRQASLSRQEDAYTGSIALLPPAKHDAERYALAAWVSRPGEQKPLQATGGWLAQAPSASEASR